MTTKWTARDIPSQRGRVAVVTGANSGIGFFAARELARAGARLFLAAAGEDRGGEDGWDQKASVHGVRGRDVAGALVVPTALLLRRFRADNAVREIRFDRSTPKKGGLDTMGEGFFLRPGEGVTHSVGDAVKICLKADANSTGGALTMYEAVLAPGFGGPPAHIHRSHDELFFVTRGTMRFRLDDRMVDAPAGSFVFAPRHVAHAISNAADVEAAFVGAFAPSRYENYFADLADLAAKRGGVPEPAEMLELMSRYDTEPAPPLARS